MKIFLNLLFFCLLSLSLSAQEGIEVLSQVDEQPRFPSCEELSDGKMKTMCAEKKMYKFIYKRLDYPDLVEKGNSQQTVVVQVRIEATGRVKVLKVLNECDPALGEAAMESLMHMPDWIPAKKGGQAVETLLNISIKFKA